MENALELKQTKQTENENPEQWMHDIEAEKRVAAWVHDKAFSEEKAQQERTRIGKERFIAVYEKTMGTFTLACESAGIPRSTVYEWRNQDPNFRAALQEIDNRQYTEVQDRLLILIQQNDGPSVRFWLQSKHPDYKPKSTLQITTGITTFEDLLYQVAQKRHDQQQSEQLQRQKTSIGVDAVERRTEGHVLDDPQQAGGGSTVHAEPIPTVLSDEEDAS